MSDEHVIDRILSGRGWLTHREIYAELRAWRFFDTLVDAARSMKRDRLYQSKVHGVNHIERVILLGSLGAMAGKSNLCETEMLLDACAYHDVGRVNDWYDTEHGERSSAVIGELTGRKPGYELDVIKAAVHAHSLPDSQMADVMKIYSLEGDDFAHRFCCMLKDADGLDRFRINDFDESYLRLDFNHGFVNLAEDMVNSWYPTIEKTL